ncbi:hypothetical protein FA95DRAFT_1611923, partial [Auriscalpium vulgare]
PPRGPIKGGSVFIRHIVEYCIAMKQSIYVGEGTNEFEMVDLDDTVDLYLRVFDLAFKTDKPTTSAYARYFVPTAGPTSWKTLVTAIGGELARRGLVTNATPHSIALADIRDPHIMLVVSASSHRIVADRPKELGWKARPVNLEDYMKADLDIILQQMVQNVT